MTIVVDRFITSYYSEKMEIDFTEFINHENSQKYKDNRSVSLESCRDKEGCYKKYKDAYLNKGEKILSDSQINDERVIKILFDKLFENTYNNLLKKYLSEGKRPLFLFPTLDSDPTGDFYFNKTPLIDKVILPDKKEIDVKANYRDYFSFIPVFSDYTESKEEFSEKVEIAMVQIKQLIVDKQNIEEAQRKETSSKPKTYTNIVIILNNDKENSFFTSMYNKELKKEKREILNAKIKEFTDRSSIGRQSITRASVKQESVKGVTISYFKTELKKIVSGDPPKGITVDRDFEQRITELIAQVNEAYKKVVDKKYVSLLTSDEQAAYLRIFYRVNLDKEIMYNEIKPGNEYLYKLTNLKVDTFDKKLLGMKVVCKEYIGFLNVVPGFKSRFTFQMHNINTKAHCSNSGEFQLVDKEDENDDEEVSEEKYVKIQLDIKFRNGNIEVMTTGKIKNKGYLSFYKDLHIYEKYRWFKFNDLDGALTAETKINIYEDTLFDKKSLIDFLKSKGTYNANTRLAVEFLKMNIDRKQLLEYTSYIYTNLYKTHIYKKSIFGVSELAFKEKCKKELMEILFQPNELIYFGGGVRAKETKTDIRKNYKIVSYNYIPTDNLEDGTFDKTYGEDPKKPKITFKGVFVKKITDHFNNKAFSKSNEEEYKYCNLHTIKNCEFLKEKVQKNESRAIVILDITKDNVDVKNLKKSSDCKRLRQTIKREVHELFNPFARYNPLKMFGGRTLKIKKNKKILKKSMRRRL
jgi:hypothetical protein